MAKSTVSASKQQASAKPAKPRRDFPLFAHSGRWAKKIKGRLVYFGKWDDHQAALNKYLEQRDDLHAGRKPRKSSDGITIKDLCDTFYTAKQQLLQNGELSPRTAQEYDSTCERIVRVFGRQRRADDVLPEDFAKLRADIAKTRGPVALSNEIQRVRCVFKFGNDQGYLTVPVRYGQSFQKPSRKTLRKEKAANGIRMLEADELRHVLDACGPVMKAMVLLAINGALGQSDLASLPMRATNLETGWLDYPRQKTGIPRRIPLWQETIDAVREAIAHRPKPKHPEDADLLFLTRCGQRWVKVNKTGTPADALGQEFAKLLVEIGIKRPGVSFYAARHSFRTVADGTRDFPAIDSLMGHVDSSMAGNYRERIDDDRLRAVVDHVHRWLWPRPTTR